MQVEREEGRVMWRIRNQLTGQPGVKIKRKNLMTVSLENRGSARGRKKTRIREGKRSDGDLGMFDQTSRLGFSLGDFWALFHPFFDSETKKGHERAFWGARGKGKGGWDTWFFPFRSIQNTFLPVSVGYTT